ncbi:MAG: DUF1552 domain-containing protein [Myxococcaceae bacterium]|nr:DUF1552 domain-containing protein [Myxococcaceae bacterium]
MSLSRRRFLGGAGALVALPAFESLWPRRAAAAAPTSPDRLLVYFLPNGRTPATWVPAAAGTSYTLPLASSGLNPFKSQLTFMSGFDHRAAREAAAIADHAKGTGPVLTNFAFNANTPLNNGISFDQLLVRELKPTTRFASLQWGAGQPAPCDFGPSTCTYTQCISWKGAGEPLGPVTSPLTAFNQLFAGSGEGATEAERARRRGSLKSVLDTVSGEAKSLKGQLSKGDGVRLDEYLSSVRELELRLTTPPSSTCTPGQAPAASLDYPSQVRAFHDLMVLALQCDLSRYVTFMIEYGLSGRSHPFVQSYGGHHALTHGGAAVLDQLVRLEKWQCDMGAELLGKLKAAKDASGASLLDSTAVLMIPDMGDPSVHDHENLAPVLVGTLNGKLKPGKAVRYAKEPLGNLYVSLAKAFGLTLPRFGVDGVKVLGELLA